MPVLNMMTVNILQADGSIRRSVRAVVRYAAPPEGLFPSWRTGMVPVPDMYAGEELHYEFGDLIPLIIRRQCA